MMGLGLLLGTIALFVMVPPIAKYLVPSEMETLFVLLGLFTFVLIITSIVLAVVGLDRCSRHPTSFWRGRGPAFLTFILFFALLVSLLLMLRR